MSKDEVGALAAKTVATGVLAAFGLTLWAIVAAFIGAIVSLHFERPAAGSEVWRVALQIVAFAFLAALVAVLLPHFWAKFGEVELAVRAGLLGVFANPIYKLGRSFIASRAKKQGG